MNPHKYCRLPAIVAVTILILFGLGICMTVQAAGPVKIKMDPSVTQKINLTAGQSLVVETGADIRRIALGAEDYADVKVLSPRQLYFVGKEPGATNATLWGADGKIAALLDIIVAPDLVRLRERIYQLMPGEKDIRVTSSQDSVVLTGTVSSASAMTQVLALVEAYAPRDKTKKAKVMNLLEVGGVHQVMLEVRVSEMSRTLLRRLGVNILGSYVNGNDRFTIGFFDTKNVTSGSDVPGLRLNSLLPMGVLDGLFNTGNVNWVAFVDALKENGLARILAEPTLITTSGQTANFLAGGEFPIPVEVDDDLTIEYKAFGVALNFTPTVLNSGKISMALKPEVSELDYKNAITLEGFIIPAITTRRLSTVIELADGQSFAVAGLLRDDIRETISKFPVLGDIPILGALFRSTAYQKNETELVVIVTPHLVKPLDIAKQTLPTDQYVDPNDFELYLLGKTEGLAEPAAKTAGTVQSSGSGKGSLEGDFGHIAP